MAIAILFSTFGCNNGLILAGPRVYCAMARDRLFFERAGGSTPSTAPQSSALGPGGLGLGPLHQRDLQPAAGLRDLRRAGFLLPDHLALFRLRRLRPDLPRPVKAFGYPVLPGLYMLAVGALMVILLFEKPLYTWPGLLIVATGIPVYLIWRGRQTAQGARHRRGDVPALP